MRDETRIVKTPRSASTYRAARRNAAKSAGQLSEWRAKAAAQANDKAHLSERRALVTGANKAASKALAAAQGLPMPPYIVAGSAMLDFYVRKGGAGRAMARVVRDLRKGLRAAA